MVVGVSFRFLSFPNNAACVDDDFCCRLLVLYVGFLVSVGGPCRTKWKVCAGHNAVRMTANGLTLHF
jgi:hypothetical protein